MMKLNGVFDKPKVIAIIGDVNQGKSMLIYNIIDELTKKYKLSIYSYGLRIPIDDAQDIYSVAEMEKVKNSVIFIDELMSLFDLDNRMEKRTIENTLRLINHNNNIVVLCGPPENFKKFLAGKVDVFFYKRVTIADFINGSRSKNVVINYRGAERGSAVLDMPKDKVLMYDGEHYYVSDVKYLKQYDTKKDNQSILQPMGKRNGR